MSSSMKPYFEMNSRFRNGILILAILMFLVIWLFFLFTKQTKLVNDFTELSIYQQQLDSLKKNTIANKKGYVLQPFNPNFITDHKGYALRLTVEELDRLYAYRKKNKWINSVSDFKKVTGISDSLIAVISPLFKFPDWIHDSPPKKTYKKITYSSKSFAQKKDLNTITIKDLQHDIEVPDFIADRIIKYRQSIGGFIDDIQLKDVKGLYEHHRNKIVSIYTVKTKREINKINVNTASVKQLIDVPYFDFETAIAIKDFIKEKSKITNFEELQEIEGFPFEKIDRIMLYLEIN